MHVFGISIKQSTRRNWTLPQLFCRTGRSSATKTLNFEMAMPRQLMSSTKINHGSEDCKWSILYSTKCFYPIPLSITTALSQFTLTCTTDTFSFSYIFLSVSVVSLWNSLPPTIPFTSSATFKSHIVAYICINSVSFHLIIFVYCFLCFFFSFGFCLYFWGSPQTSTCSATLATHMPDFLSCIKVWINTTTITIVSSSTLYFWVW